MNKRRSILQFLLTYLCVLLPLLGTSILITQNFLDQARQEENEKMSGQIAAVEAFISENYWDYRTKGVILFENREFSSNQVLFNSSAAGNAVHMLQSLRLFDNSANEILLYYGKDYLYASNGLVSPYTFFKNTLSCSSDGIEDALEVISTTEFAVRILEGGSSGGYLLYHIPIGEDRYGYMRSMEVVINFSELEKMLRTCLNSENLLLRLASEDDECYFYHTKEGLQFVTREQAGELLTDYEDAPWVGTGGELGFEVSAWCNVEEQLAEFYRLRNINIILLMVGLSLSTVLSFGLSLRRFSLLKTLLNNIANKNISHKAKKKWNQNEFDHIQLILDEFIKENVSMRKNAQSYREALFQQVSILLFHGLITDYKEVQSLLEVCGTTLSEEYFFVFGLKVDSHEQLERLDALFQGDIHYVMNEEERKFLFILCELPCFDFDMKMRRNLADNLQAALGGADIRCNQMVMSQVYNQISMTNYAYLEVLSILENIADKKTYNLCWEEWTKSSGMVYARFGNECLKAFREAVSDRDYEQSCQILKASLQQIGAKKDDLRFLCYMLLQSMMLEMNSMYAEEENREMLLELATVNLDNVVEFETEMCVILQKYCSQKTEQPENNFDKILQFVEANYASYDLSLDKVANYAGTSKSQMSKLFKKYVGVSYIDYVTKLRMEKAKELLVHTDISIKDVFRKVGYIDTTNASKKFKAYFNVTPSLWRSMGQEEREKARKDK